MNAKDVEDRIKQVKLLILDVDGVLTDGHIAYGDYGDELKYYDVLDGFGIQLLRKGGIASVIITAKKSKINVRRARDLQIAHVYQDAQDKLLVFAGVLKKMGLAPDEVCCIGDDLVDIPVMSRAGFAVAVQNAVPDVKRIAHYVTARNGGRGAVREVADKILKTQGKWGVVTEKYFT
jgi:3-deoxy-D-manno-octulosonate 8-phosphate phosphatase (KDO 8-P phosphatase)